MKFKDFDIMVLDNGEVMEYNKDNDRDNDNEYVPRFDTWDEYRPRFDTWGDRVEWIDEDTLDRYFCEEY